MKRFLIKTGIAGALTLCAFAAPSQASAIFNFVSTGSSCTGTGCGTASGSGNTLSALSISDWTKFTVQVGATTETWDLTGTLLYTAGSPDSFTLTGTASCDAISSSLCGTKTTGASQSLLTFGVGSNPGTYSSFNLGSQEAITIATATSLTETAVFLNTLGLSAPTGTPTGFSGGASTTGNTSPFTLTASSTLAFTSNQVFTPEPVTFALFGSGLLLIGFIARRRQRRAAVDQTI
jgi:hypothetical protein